MLTGEFKVVSLLYLEDSLQSNDQLFLMESAITGHQGINISVIASQCFSERTQSLLVK